MKILKPDITVHWNQGVSVKARGLLFINPTATEADITVYVTISGTDQPVVLITATEGNSWAEGTTDLILKYIPGAMEVVNTWVDGYDLITIWGREVVDYNYVMGLVDLPDADITEGDRKVWYRLTIKPSGKLPPIEITIALSKEIVDSKGGAWIHLQLDSGETDDDWDNIMCSMCNYYLELPITMGSLRNSIAKVFQQYVDYLLAGVSSKQ